MPMLQKRSLSKKGENMSFGEECRRISELFKQADRIKEEKYQKKEAVKDGK